MDFPVNLSSLSWVYGLDELRQNVITLLSNSIRSFIQSPNLGALFDVHVSDDSMIEEGVRRTLSQIPYIKVVDVKAKESNDKVAVTARIVYNSEVINFQYSFDL